MNKAERNAKFGKIDTADWPNHELAVKATLNPDALSYEEARAWLDMLLTFGMTDPYILKKVKVR